MTRHKSVTVLDVARRAGVSRSAASMALNNYSRNTLAEGTRKKIIEVARDMGFTFKVNTSQGTTSKRIEYCCFGGFGEAGNIYHDFLNGASHQAHEELCEMTISELPRLFREGIDTVSRLPRGMVDGCLVTGLVSSGVIHTLQKRKLPTVIIGNYLFPSCPYPVIQAGYPSGLEKVLHHLQSQGKKSCMVFENAHVSRYVHQQVRSTCVDVSQEIGLHLSLYPITDEFAEEGAAEALSSSTPPDILIAEPIKAIAAERIIAARQLDTTLVIYGAPSQMYHLPRTRAWTLTANSDEMGQLGMKTLLDMVRGRSVPPGNVQTVDVKIQGPIGESFGTD